MLRSILFAFLVLTACTSTPHRGQPVVVLPRDVMVESAFQRQLVLEQRLADRWRLETLQFRIMGAAVALCRSKTRPYYGLFAATEHSFGPRMRGPARKGFGLGEALEILFVVPGSPADLAGLENGATISAIDGEPLPPGEAGKTRFAAALGGASGDGVTLTVDHGGRRSVSLTPVEICDYDVELSPRQGLNAYPIDGKVAVTRAMLWFARDDELALVIAHELAHYVMDHAATAFAAPTNIKEIEAEADYVGLYMMAWAGYDIDRAPRCWRRLAAHLPGATGSAASHPATPYRYLVMKQAVEEIRSKIAAGRPLVPDLAGMLAEARPAD